MANLSDEELARQARQHLESLKVNGVEWLPKATAPMRRRPVAPGPPAPSLFDPPAPPPAATVELTAEQRRTELTLLNERGRTCTKCCELAATRTQGVLAVGCVEPDICFIGEAAGADEERQGAPCVGAAGQLLNNIIKACGL